MSASLGHSEQSLSVTKAITILSAVADAHVPPTVSEIIAKVGFGKTVVLRMIATLTAHRLLERDVQSNRYMLGTGLITLAHTAISKHPLSLRAAPVLSEIVRTTGDIGLLMVEDRGMALCIERKVGASPIATVGTNIGTRSPLHCGGGPFALLAFSSDEFISEYLSQPLEARTAATVTDPEKIWDRIREAREHGYTIGNEDLFQYVVAVGVPIRDAGGKLLGSLSIGSINHRYPADRCREIGIQLRDLCRDLL